MPFAKTSQMEQPVRMLADYDTGNWSWLPRGDVAWAAEATMREPERRHQSPLCRLRMTLKLEGAIKHAMAATGWRPADHGR